MLREAGTARSAGESAWDLVLVGDGPESAALRQLAREHNVANAVRFAGAEFDYEKIVCWLAFARGLVLPSHESEQWGLVVNEALAAGLPVLVSRQCGCSASLVDDQVNGRLFDGKSVAQIAQAIGWLHDNDGRREQLSQRSLQIAEQFTPQRLAEKIHLLYRKIACKDNASAT